MIDAGKKKAAELGKAINPPRSRCLDTSGEAFLHNQGPKQTFASCSQTGESKLAPAICCRCRIFGVSPYMAFLLARAADPGSGVDR
jgi:hypothetical protein